MTPLAHKNHNNFSFNLGDYANVLIIIILILFSIAAYALILGPKFSNTKEAIHLSIQGNEKLYASSQKKLAVLSDIQKVYQNIKPSDLQKFNTVLPGEYVPERLFGELGEIVKNGGWLVNSIKFAPAINTQGKSRRQIAQILATTNRPGLKEIKLSLTVSAIDYPGLKRLLSSLEDNLRLIDVQDVEFSPTAHTATLKLITYYYRTAS